MLARSGRMFLKDVGVVWGGGAAGHERFIPADSTGMKGGTMSGGGTLKSTGSMGVVGKDIGKGGGGSEVSMGKTKAGGGIDMTGGGGTLINGGSGS